MAGVSYQSLHHLWDLHIDMGTLRRSHNRDLASSNLMELHEIFAKKIYPLLKIA